MFVCCNCSYLTNMREHYYQAGAQFELPSELKVSLKLMEPAHWTVQKLQAVQDRIGEPLVVYWWAEKLRNNSFFLSNSSFTGKPLVMYWWAEKLRNNSFFLSNTAVLQESLSSCTGEQKNSEIILSFYLTQQFYRRASHRL